MISRRPNIRASSEKAPGPSTTIPSSMATAKTIASLESNIVGVQGGSSENPRATVPRTATAPAIGVRKPISNNAPEARADKPISQFTFAPSASRR